MKREKGSTHKKLSANEINRFIYCPYQWYYGRYYGQTALKDQYKALGSKHSKTEVHFTKGIKFHKAYYRSYRIKRLLMILGFILVIAILVGSFMRWSK